MLINYACSALQCWEHIQPLLKFNTISQGEQIHVAAWPALFPHLGFEPFSMADEGCEIISRTYAIEAQAFVIMSTSLITSKNAAAVGLDFGANGPPAGTFFQPPGGGRAGVFAPDGRKLTQTVPADREAIIYCDIDLSLCSQAKLLADPVGHYVRPDLLRLVVRGHRLYSLAHTGTNLHPFFLSCMQACGQQRLTQTRVQPRCHSRSNSDSDSSSGASRGR